MEGSNRIDSKNRLVLSMIKLTFRCAILLFFCESMTGVSSLSLCGINNCDVK